MSELDIIVYGATGFTGRLVCEHLNDRYGVGGEINWAIAGRNQAKLVQVRDEIGIDQSIPVIVADTQEKQSIDAMVARTKVVLSTAGPYQSFGSYIVQACAETGTDYIDINGEPAWMREMIGSYHEKARETGARIVFSGGFDSLPSDMGVFLVQQVAIEKLGNPVPRVKARVLHFDTLISGGSMATFHSTLAATEARPELVDVLQDPFALTPGFVGAEQPAANEAIYEDDIGSWFGSFFMAPTNVKTVHRSNFLLNHRYGKNFAYDEMIRIEESERGRSEEELVAEVLDYSLKPGDGPGREQREAGSYDILFTGIADNGDRVRVSVKGDMDGYGSSAKMVSEVAACLLEKGRDSVGGCLTTASALGATLIARLEKYAGLTFQVENIG